MGSGIKFIINIKLPTPELNNTFQICMLFWANLVQYVLQPRIRNSTGNYSCMKLAIGNLRNFGGGVRCFSFQ